jgi:hypothetical protein
MVAKNGWILDSWMTTPRMITKCQGDERTGASLLRFIDRLAESIPFAEYVTLNDKSNIRICDVPMFLHPRFCPNLAAIRESLSANEVEAISEVEASNDFLNIKTP